MLVGLGLAGLVASAPAAAAEDEAPAANDVPLRVTPFVRVTTVGTNGKDLPAILADTYTRLEIGATLPGPKAQPIAYKKRNLIWRIGIGKKYTFNSVLKVDAGRFRDTIPLFTRDYASSRKAGESFGRSIGYDRFAFPWFLASAGSASRVAAFSLSTDMVDTTDSQASSIALGALRQALKAVAPGSTLLTTLTEDSSDKVAAKIDEQASQLFGTSVAEQVAFDLDLSQAKTYRIELYGPLVETDELMHDKKIAKSPPLLGSWTVRMADSRPSVFAIDKCGPNNCDEAATKAYNHAKANSAAILAFKLVEQVGDIGTIKAYLTQQDWWTAALDQVKGSKPDYGAFCRQIRSSMAELGLNDLDGRIVAYSVGQSGLIPSVAKAGIESESAYDCKK